MSFEPLEWPLCEQNDLIISISQNSRISNSETAVPVLFASKCGKVTCTQCPCAQAIYPFFINLHRLLFDVQSLLLRRWYEEQICQCRVMSCQEWNGIPCMPCMMHINYSIQYREQFHWGSELNSQLHVENLVSLVCSKSNFLGRI